MLTRTMAFYGLVWATVVTQYLESTDALFNLFAFFNFFILLSLTLQLFLSFTL